MPPQTLTLPKNQTAFNKLKIIEKVDTYKDQLKELFEIRNPKLRGRPDSEAKAEEFANKYLAKFKKPEQAGRWVYYPWKKIVVHLLNPKEFFELRTVRNKNLITKKEQEKFYKCKVGIAGLSVGNHAAMALILEGGAWNLKIGDFDELSVSNLNRLRSSCADLGLHKVEMTARQIYEINPDTKLELFDKGVTEKNLDKFLSGLDVFVDEMDSFQMKVIARLAARKKGIAVISAVDNGDNVCLHIERFDLNKKLSLFHGAFGDKINPDDFKIRSLQQAVELSTKMFVGGAKNIPSRMKKSLLQIGKELHTWPQLGGSAMLSGSAVAYAVRKIAINEKLDSGLYHVNLDNILIPEYDSEKNKKAMQKETKEFLEKVKEL